MMGMEITSKALVILNLREASALISLVRGGMGTESTFAEQIGNHLAYASMQVRKILDTIAR